MSADESRLEALRKEAAETGRVRGAGMDVRGGPLPRGWSGAEGRSKGTGGSGRAPEGPGVPSGRSGYHGRPVLKPPPWTWEVPVYLFVGGLAGAAATLALAGALTGAGEEVVRSALWLALLGVLVSAPLLVSDLGRPARFLNMLRVFKWRSPMSVGVWLLTAFGGATATALVAERLAASGAPAVALVFILALGAAGLLGAVLATYTGVLLAATAVPAWNAHTVSLPVHFGAAALGSAAAALELLGHRLDALHLLGILAAATETLILLRTELSAGRRDNRALRRGRSGLLVRTSGLLVGPAALALRIAGWRSASALVFLAGALLSRFGWIHAGRASTLDPESVL